MNEKQKNYPLIKSKKLLNEDNNAKTVKGQKLNYMTAILYLASSDNSGFNVCSEASEGCRLACLYSAGHGAFTNVQNGRINKTRWYFLERETFLIQLKKEISAFIVKAEKKGFKPCIRLNGTSDIPWENHDIIQSFPNVQFYDYSKSYKRALKFINGELPKNFKGFNVLNADETDLRFLDIKNSICGLVAKGKAKKDYSGFVLDTQ